MTDTRLNSIEKDLKEAESQLTATLCGLRDQVAQGEAELKRVRKALSALVSKSTAKGKARRPAANGLDVCKAIAAVLEDQGAVAEADLKTMTEERITSDGKSLQGFALRFREALTDSQRFENTPGGYRLAGNEGDGNDLVL